MFIDTNVLVRARFTVAPGHASARARLRDAVGGRFDIGPARSARPAGCEELRRPRLAGAAVPPI
jgi:hypothetical protein